MAVLTEAQLKAITRQLMKEMSQQSYNPGILKTDLYEVVEAADGWSDSNAASYNTALPQPGRSALSAKWKARVLNLITKTRFEVS